MHEIVKSVSLWNVYLQRYDTMYFHSLDCVGCKLGMPV